MDYKKHLKLLALFLVFINCPQGFSRGQDLDNFTTAFFSALVAPSDGSPCVAVSRAKMPLFLARKEACAKNASFLKEGNQCFMVIAGKDAKDRLAANNQYCFDGYFDSYLELQKDKQVNRSALEGVKRGRAVDMKP